MDDRQWRSTYRWVALKKRTKQIHHKNNPSYNEGKLNMEIERVYGIAKMLLEADENLDIL